MILNSIVKMVRGIGWFQISLSGPITIAKVAGQSAEMGWQTFISFMALMSVSLGILNLLTNSDARWWSFNLLFY